MSLKCKEDANVRLIVSVSIYMFYRPDENKYIKLGPRQKSIIVT